MVEDIKQLNHEIEEKNNNVYQLKKTIAITNVKMLIDYFSV